jgi:hypothetical protein
MDTICESPLENEPLKIYRKRAFNELSLTHKKRECKSIRGLVGGNSTIDLYYQRLLCLNMSRPLRIDCPND